MRGPGRWCCLRASLLLILVALLAGAGCSNRGDPCGDGFRDVFETCDGEDFGGETCLSLGFKSGQLVCGDDCSLDTSACSQEEFCEPACDPGQCTTCRLGDCVSACRDWETCEAGSCTSETVAIRLFFTSDEHGWIFSEWSSDHSKFYGGAAGLMTLLRQRGYEPGGGDSLLLSDGDMWTGPAISTWYQGASVVEVMNAMGYTAAAVGNHEFDFGQDVLVARSEESAFPFLAANLKDEASGAAPVFAQSHVVREVNGLQVGVIGMTIDDLPSLVCSDELQGLLETGYDRALRDTVPLALADGAEVLVLVSHTCPEDLMRLTGLAAELGIAVMAGGHCHSTFMGSANGVLVVSPGAYNMEVAQVDLLVEPVSATVVDKEDQIISNVYPADGPGAPDPDPAIGAIVDTWLDRVAADLGEVIGYTETGLGGWPMYNMTTDGILAAVPEADLALVNTTGFRSSYRPGDITVAHTVEVQPFDNTLVVVELSGADLLATIDGLYWPEAIAGATVDKRGGLTQVTVGGEPVYPEATYRMVTLDYLVCQPDFFPFQFQSQQLTFTGMHWRQATEDWLRALDTSGEDPLEEFVDPAPRWLD